MFVEQKSGEKQGAALRFDGFMRRHPAAFTAALILLTVAITIGLLAKAGQSVVLYQGF